MYKTKQKGSKYSNDFEVYIFENEKLVSPWHDIPLMSGEYINCINEIPRFENAKFEISKKDSFNPIKQDSKKGKVRFVKNLFPTKGYPFNYGAIPQTWEDPRVKDKLCDAYGDNDPLDVIEIGSKVKKIGQVYRAKVLGAFPLIDEGETDWKIIVIDSEDKLASKINNIEDIEKVMPGLIKHIFFWLEHYKIPDGKPVNKFGLNKEWISATQAMEIIKECNHSWKMLISEGFSGSSIDNATLGSGQVVSRDTGDMITVMESDIVGDFDQEYFFIGK